jgi:DNA-binding NtrC family response regulator
VLYLLYTYVWEEIQKLIEQPAATLKRVAAYDGFLRQFRHFLPKEFSPTSGGGHAPEVIFAGFFQVRRAFHFAFSNVIGSSLPAAQLRAAIWQSIFTHDMRRYQRVLFDRMGDFTTLITGPSGTGKEIVARAIALSRFIPFDPRARTFAEEYSRLFHPLNISALSPTLVESELFGHKRGAYTGALEDRRGWLEMCPPLGCVFLDEIGDLDPMIQVKLLRVLQSRTFQRLGETQDRHFAGKIIAATNRDLSAEMERGAFRRDFYYRLCSDIIVTPSLREQLAQSPEDLGNLIRFICKRVVGESEAERVADEVEGWITKHLGRDYAWPGNFRELEQCVRNVLVRREYRPPQPPAAVGSRDNLIDSIFAGKLTADELLQRYCRLVYAQTHSYVETARRLQLDRRTVKSKVDG